MADAERHAEAKDCVTINLGTKRITRQIPLVNGKLKQMFSGQSIDPRTLRSDFKFMIPCHEFLPDILNGEAFIAIQPASLWKFHRVQYRWWMGQPTFVLTALTPEDDTNLNMSQAFILKLVHEPNHAKLMHSLLF